MEPGKFRRQTGIAKRDAAGSDAVYERQSGAIIGMCDPTAKVPYLQSIFNAKLNMSRLRPSGYTCREPCSRFVLTQFVLSEIPSAPADSELSSQ